MPQALRIITNVKDMDDFVSLPVGQTWIKNEDGSISGLDPATLMGAAGATGAMGATGATGETGPEGPQGIQGAAGSDGENAVTFANASVRAAAVPSMLGQIGWQIDTQTVWFASATTAGAWTQIPYTALAGLGTAATHAAADFDSAGAAAAVASSHLPLSGGTLSGSLTCDGIYVPTGGFHGDGGELSSDGSGNLALNSLILPLSALSADGSVLFDTGAISSDGNGNLTASSFNGYGGNLTGLTNEQITDPNWQIYGDPLYADSGAITSDGSGVITANGFAGPGDNLTFSGQNLATFLADQNYAVIGISIGAFDNDIGYVVGPFNSAASDPDITSDGSGNLIINSLGSDGGNIASDGAGKFFIKKLRISDLPTSNDGLSSGDVWNNSGILNIV